MGAAVQQINLYRPVGGQWAQTFTPQTATLALLVLVAGAFAVSLYAWLGVRSSERAVDEVVEQTRGRSERITAVGDQLRVGGTMAQLSARTAQLAQLSAQLRLVLQKVGDPALGRTQGYSSQLRAVALARIDGVWVERISIKGNSAAIELQGTATDAQLLPQYLASLGRQSALGLHGVRELAIESSAIDGSANGAVDFHISQSDAGAAAP
jgi:hypothetical protein